MPRTAARLLVDCLVEQGCDRVFTVPGESFLPVLDALRDCDAIHTVTCRQEGGAAFMACAGRDTNGRGAAVRPSSCSMSSGSASTTGPGRPETAVA